MNNINLISGVSSLQFPRFKQKNKAIPNTSYITPDVTMMGLDANASYNMYKKYNCTEKLNIPILSPIKIEEDLDKIVVSYIKSDSTKPSLSSSHFA